MALQRDYTLLLKGSYPAILGESMGTIRFPDVAVDYEYKIIEHSVFEQ
jgi:hypothetical protein